MRNYEDDVEADCGLCGRTIPANACPKCGQGEHDEAGVQITTKEGLVAFAESKGSHFFERATMRFFDSRLLEDVVTKNGFVYFVTSERFRDRNLVAPRKYSVRRMSLETASTDYAVGKFQDFADARTAKAAMRECLNAPTALMYVVAEMHDGLVDDLTVCDTESEAQNRLMCLEGKRGTEGSRAYVILSDKTTRPICAI